jgi:hypothetical protein
MSRILSWLRSESHAEKLIARALVDFAEGDTKTALGVLLEGILELADGTKAEPALVNLQARLASFNLIPPLDRPTAGTNAAPPTPAADNAAMATREHAK